MTYGLKLRRNNVVSLDTSVAAGGVSLGIFTVPAGGGNFDFPAFTTEDGVVLAAGTGIGAQLGSFNRAPGYLRFVFPAAAAGSQVGLFAK